MAEEIVASDVAEDLSDQTSWSGRLGWLFNATLRLSAGALVIIAFLLSILTLNARFEADQALASNQTAGLAELAEMGGGLGVSSATDPQMLANAQVAGEKAKARKAIATQEISLLSQLAELEERLKKLAARSGCTAATVDQALACAPGASSDETLRAEHAQTQKQYRETHARLIQTREGIPLVASDLDAALSQPGGELVEVLPALEARDEIAKSVPPLEPAVDWFFGLPLLISSVIVAWLGGMFGSVVVLLLLLAFPTYAPLTFGGGKYFFLRMFTGGFIAIIVSMVLQSGINVTGLAEFTSIASGIDLANPVKIALIGMFAGAFTEQITAKARDFVSSFTGGSASVAPAPRPISPPPRRTVPPAPVGTPAMGPGAMDESVG